MKSLQNVFFFFSVLFYVQHRTVSNGKGQYVFTQFYHVINHNLILFSFIAENVSMQGRMDRNEFFQTKWIPKDDWYMFELSTKLIFWNIFLN